MSIVSHGHGALALDLLQRLADVPPDQIGPRRVVLTCNRPEPGLVTDVRRRFWPFDLQLIENAHPAGFGTNHNRAFACDQALGGSPAFAVLNPDIRWTRPPWALLLPALQSDPAVGCAYPRQVDACGAALDSERLLPTPQRLWRRHLGDRTVEVATGQTPDWVNAAFLLLRTEAFQQVQGFDARYHMYCEDVDLCLRLQLAGWGLRRVDTAVVEHDAQRASRRQLRHMVWHLQSMFRLWASPVWHAYRTQSRGSAGAAPARPGAGASRQPPNASE